MQVIKFSAIFRATLTVLKWNLTALCFAGLILTTAKVYADPIKVTVKLDVKAGTTQSIDAVGCAENITPSNAAKVVDWDNKKVILVSLPSNSRDELRFTADTSDSPPDSNGKCVNTSQKDYVVTAVAPPEVSEKVLIKSFQVVMAAFVLALLLENAFALLFNWRVFQLFFAGRAWKTPIMFLASYLAVKVFNVDLMGGLVNAYNPNYDVSNNLITQLFTAMTLAGGSAGVNKIFIGLGFRSQLTANYPVKLGTSKAWLSVVVNHTISATSKPKQYVVSIEEIKGDLPQDVLVMKDVAGIAGTPKPKLRDVFFGNRYRVPLLSGGMQIDSSKYYYIKIIDLSNGDIYDIQGKRVDTTNKLNAYGFMAGSVLDLSVNIEEVPT